MQPRPKLKIELTSFDKTLEALCLVSLVVLWVGTIAGFSKLPNQIPSHFNALGQVDDYSGKRSIFVLPLIATVIYIGISLLNRYPHIYNYPTNVTAENAQRLYTSATRFIRVLKLIVVVIFSGIVFMTFRTVLANGNGLGIWFLPASLVLIFSPIFFYLVKQFNSKQSL